MENYYFGLQLYIGLEMIYFSGTFAGTLYLNKAMNNEYT